MKTKSRALFWLIGLVIVLNLILSFHNIWPTPWITTRFEIAVEAVCLVFAIGLIIETRGSLNRTLATGLGLGLWILVIGRYADVTAPALYGRPINLFWDSQHIPGVVAMFGRAASWWQIALIALALAFIVVVSIGLLRRLLVGIADGLAVRQRRRTILAGCGVTMIVWLVSQTVGFEATNRWFSQPVSLSYADQFHRLYQAMNAKAAHDFAIDPLISPGLDRIERANVLVMFIESYGITALENPAHESALFDARERLSNAIANTGNQVVSTLVNSPTFGGGSWLAHSSFLSGHDVRDQATYQRLLASDRHTWVKRFSEQGYRTVGLVPGIRLAWPEGAYYGFDQIYDAQRLDYRGPEFGWWRIPDQYSLAKATALEASANHANPTMMFFTTITSHAPFRPIAPYLSDWSALLDTRPYATESQESIQANKPDWSNLSPAYLESIDYALTTLAGYVEHQAAQDLIVVVIGDHQPASSVTGPQAAWSVPVHIIANRKQILDTLTEQGFTPGLLPKQTIRHAMHTLTNQLLSAFSSQPDPPPDQVAD